MTRSVLFAVIAVVAFSLPALPAVAKSDAQLPVLRTGFVEFPPFKYADEDGHASGPWVEMTEKVAAEAGYRVEWIQLPIARVYRYLESGDIDFWPGVEGIPQLQGHVVESDVTPMRVVLYAFHRKNVEAPDSQEFLVGKSLILIGGFSYLGALDHLPLADEDVSRAPNHHTALRMLELGRGRYLLDYDEPVRAVQHEFPDLELTGTPIFRARGAFVMSLAHPNAHAIMRELENAYRRLVDGGEIDALQ